MKNISLLVLFISVLAYSSNAQSLMSSSGEISLHSEKKNISASCQSFTGKLDFEKNEVVFSVPIQGFSFKSASMQKHFNQEAVMDSQQFPKAKFKGTFTSDDDLNEIGVHAVQVSGDMTIKGVTKEFTSDGTIETTSDGTIVKTSFTVNREDYNINQGKAKMTSKVIEIDVNVVFN